MNTNSWPKNAMFNLSCKLEMKLNVHQRNQMRVWPIYCFLFFVTEILPCLFVVVVFLIYVDILASIHTFFSSLFENIVQYLTHPLCVVTFKIYPRFSVDIVKFNLTARKHPQGICV